MGTNTPNPSSPPSADRLCHWSDLHDALSAIDGVCELLAALTTWEAAIQPPALVPVFDALRAAYATAKQSLEPLDPRTSRIVAEVAQ